MTANAAQVRYPHGRVLLQRTKLAYVHLRNLIGHAKRDRTGRVTGYVPIWLPEEFVTLFLREGEVVNAVAATKQGAETIAIATALARVPPEPEFGEIAFYEAPAELIACIYQSLVVPDTPWPPDLAAADPRALFPYLRAEQFTGTVEVDSRETANFLLLRNGLIDRTFIVDDRESGRSEQLARLFGPLTPKPRARVRAWPGDPCMPVQAPSALIAAYRDVIGTLYAELGSYGVPVPSAVGERVRHALLPEHPSLTAFAAGVKVDDPAESERAVTAAVAAWVTETIREALDGDDEAATSVVRAAARERRHMLHAAGFLSALPWELDW